MRFDGREALFKHEQGATYVAYLLLNPPAEPIHALDLCARLNGAERNGSGIAELVDPTGGEVKQLDAGARLQERGLALEDAETMRAVLRTQEQLEALLEDEDRTEPEKQEAQRELIALYDYEKKHSCKIRDNAGKAADAVGRAMKRFYAHLAGAVDGNGGPHPVLRAFAEHIREHVLVPSGRCCGRGGPRPNAGVAGCFMYQPPTGVVWTA